MGTHHPPPSRDRGNPPTLLMRAVDYFWLSKRWETTDDRAVPVRVFMPDVFAIRETDLAAGVLSPSEYRALKKEIIRRMPAASRQLRNFARIGIAVLAILIALQLANGPWHTRAILIDLLLLRALPLMIFVLILRGVGDSPQTVREVFIAHRRCPSCGYDLHGQPAQPDACTICPECAAAWKLLANH